MTNSRLIKWSIGLAREKRGSTFAMMAVGLIVAIASLGSAIDAGRMYIVKSQLQAGVDAAALAGARAFGVTDNSPNSRTSQVNAYFKGNFPITPAYMGTTNIIVTPTFAVVNGFNVTTVTAQATIGMSFMRIFGFTSQTMTAVAKAELQPRPLEVMLVLDNTGSMRGKLPDGTTRMTALKTAAKDFVDVLFQGSAQRQDLALGILPYDITANVGNLLSRALPNSVATLDGFNSPLAAKLGTWPTNTYYWKGCVMNDSTVKDVSVNRLVSENGAWDLTRTLPGEGSNPAVQPYFIPPIYAPAVKIKDAVKTNREDPYYKHSSDEAGNNLYRFDKTTEGTTWADDMVNSAAYRSWFYDYYIDLNDTYGKDVIVNKDGSYYDPKKGHRSSKEWKVEWRNLPFIDGGPSYPSPWANIPGDSIVNKSGGTVDDKAKFTTPGRNPNWQCPEEALLPKYNQTKSVYTDYIDNKNGAIFPANGTIHQAGLLWGYRLLVRDDKFERPRPTGMTTEPARRAIVFMTDGVNEVGEQMNEYTDRTFTWYGRWTDKSISASNDPNVIKEQMLRRFEKTCANIQRDTANGTRPAPLVYIIALVANSTRINTAFDNCAPGRVYRTTNTIELNRAFKDVASELIDLHLVQ